jgi:hypothetical protein
MNQQNFQGGYINGGGYMPDANDGGYMNNGYGNSQAGGYMSQGTPGGYTSSSGGYMQQQTGVPTQGSYDSKGDFVYTAPQ